MIVVKDVLEEKNKKLQKKYKQGSGDRIGMAHIEKEYLIGDVELGDEEKRAK